MVSGYLNQANVVLNMIAANPQAGQVKTLLSAADGNATQAPSQLQAMNYRQAASLAKTAYWQVMSAAAQINVQVEPQSWQADYKAKGVTSEFVDSVFNHHPGVTP